jgi:bacteriocin biosynthesis cyclodehydratase domain-containing protein
MNAIASATGPATVLPPAARLLWRASSTAQIELGTRAVIIDGVDTGAVRTLIGADDANDPGASAPSGLPALQAHLLDTGYLWPRAPTSADPRRLVAHPRLGGELTALSARAGERAAEIISARQECTVLVQGCGRAGPLVAALLAAAGVGRVHCLDAGAALLHHAIPGGLLPGDEGMSFAAAAAAAIERQAPDAACTTAPFDEPPDLVVLAVDAPVDPERRNALHSRSAAHLLVQASGGRGSVGPLVLPGLTSCLRCADLHRLDRDPAWDALAVQLAIPQRRRGASEVALAATIAGVAAMAALEFLDGGRPATIEGTLEMQAPDWRLRRRTWPIHPDCDCLARTQK